MNVSTKNTDITLAMVQRNPGWIVAISPAPAQHLCLKNSEATLHLWKKYGWVSASAKYFIFELFESQQQIHTGKIRLYATKPWSRCKILQD